MFSIIFVFVVVFLIASPLVISTCSTQIGKTVKCNKNRSNDCRTSYDEFSLFCRFGLYHSVMSLNCPDCSDSALPDIAISLFCRDATDSLIHFQSCTDYGRRRIAWEALLLPHLIQITSVALAYAESVINE